MEYSYYSRKDVENMYEFTSPMLYKLAQQANSDAELLDPQNYAGHIIESGVVLCIDRHEVLLISKKGQDTWFTPSSHIVGSSYRGGDFALRAIEEMTGISEYDNDTISLHSLLDSSIDICTILVPENLCSEEPQHYHIEFRYAFDYNGPKEINIAEDYEYRWVSIDDPSIDKITSVDKIKELITQPRYTKVLLNIMHSSPEIPNWDIFKYQAELKKKIFKNTAWFTDRLFGCDQCYSFVYPYSQYYHDVEHVVNNFNYHKDHEHSVEYYFSPNPKDRHLKKLSEEEEDNICKTIIAHDEAIEKEYEIDAIVIQCGSFNDDDPNFKGVDIYISCQSRDYNTATFKTIKKCFSQWKVAVEKEYYKYCKSISAHEQMFTIKVNKRLYMDIVNGKPMYRALSDVRKAILDMYDKLLRRPLTPNDYARNCMSEEEIMAICDDDISSVYVDSSRWGTWYRDKLLIEAKYTHGLNFNNGLAAVKLDGKCGYIDKMERMAIPAIYDKITPFRDGIALVCKDRELILIDVKGVEISRFKRDSVEYLGDGVIAAKVNGKWGYVNTKDEELTGFIYDKIDTYYRYKVMQNGKCGLLNKDFTIAVDCIYEDVSSCGSIHSIYCVKQKHKYGLVNTKGDVILPIIYDKINNESSVVIVQKGGKYGAYNYDGKMLLDAIYDKIDFCDDVFVLKLEEKYSIANQDGDIIITPTYDYIGEFDNGVSTCLRDGKYSIINRMGKTLVDNIVVYDEVKDFYRGVAVVIYNGKRGLINVRGELVAPLEYDYIFYLYPKLILVWKGDYCGLINCNNEVICDIKYTKIERLNDRYAEFISADGRKGKIDMQGNEVCSYIDLNEDNFRIGKFGL